MILFGDPDPDTNTAGSNENAHESRKVLKTISSLRPGSMYPASQPGLQFGLQFPRHLISTRHHTGLSRPT
jgi:hypothetical protein